MQSTRTLEKLEWSKLTEKLSVHAQSAEAQSICRDLIPNRSNIEIEQRWTDSTSLRDLVRAGYKSPVGDIKNPRTVFLAADKGQILEGTDLRLVLEILHSTKRVASFIHSFANRSPFLARVKPLLSPLTSLLQAIEKAVAPDGSLNDDASDELSAIRKHKTSLRKRIEDTLMRVLHDQEFSEYLQDDFFTFRNDRYVVPIRIDGRGRVKGHIVDTSDSGQTLYLEPTAIASLNHELQDVDVAEKLEIIRIFRELSSFVARDLDALRTNYQNLIEIDVLTAEACLAFDLDAGAVLLSSKPCLGLIEARHPLIKTPSGKTAEPNNIALEDQQQNSQKILVVSGPNAGGKTVVLKTTGLLHLMARAGLLIPADPKSKMFLFESIYLEMGDSQNITANLSTFSGHLLGLKPIIENATANDLVLLDELTTGTEPQTGAAIARSILEHFANKQVTTIATTHYDGLKGLAVSDHRYRNASMEYMEDTYRPTYRLILDVPGQSYGLELATQMGLPASIIERAKTLKGSSHSELDEAVSALQKARLQSESLKIQLNKELLEAQSAKARWQDECKLLEEQRAKATRSVAAKLENEVDTLRSEFESKAKELRTVVKEIRTGNIDTKAAYEKKRETEESLRNIESSVNKMAHEGVKSELPGMPVSAKELREGLNVFVLPLKKEGIIAKLGATPNDPIEVQVGIIKVRVSLLDLRKTRGSDHQGGQPTSTQANAKSGNKSSNPNNNTSTNNRPIVPEFVPQTPRNTLDLRGTDSDFAVEKSLNFIDKSMLAGEKFIVIIHGHGSDRLKLSIRQMLRQDCPYNISYRAGIAGEGGDGVTVIAIG